MIKVVNLYAPREYWLLAKDRKAKIVSGCGPKSANFLVPETLWGLSITEACNIHDYMYWVGETREDKEKADRVFLNNMLRIIEARTKWTWLKWLRRARAKKYYLAVKWFGAPAYWKNKNYPAEMRTQIV